MNCRWIPYPAELTWSFLATRIGRGSRLFTVCSILIREAPGQGVSTCPSLSRHWNWLKAPFGHSSIILVLTTPSSRSLHATYCALASFIGAQTLPRCRWNSSQSCLYTLAQCVNGGGTERTQLPRRQCQTFKALVRADKTRPIKRPTKRPT